MKVVGLDGEYYKPFDIDFNTSYSKAYVSFTIPLLFPFLMNSFIEFYLLLPRSGVFSSPPSCPSPAPVSSTLPGLILKLAYRVCVGLLARFEGPRCFGLGDTDLPRFPGASRLFAVDRRRGGANSCSWGCFELVVEVSLLLPLPLEVMVPGGRRTGGL